MDVVSTALLRNSLVLASQLDFSLMWVAKGCLVFQPCVIKGSLQYQSALERHAEFFSRDGLLSVEWFNRLDDATSAHFPGLQQLLIRDGIEYHRILLAPFSPGERCAADRAGTDVVSALPITVGTRLLRSYLPLIRQASAAEARALALQRLHQTVADTVDELLVRVCRPRDLGCHCCPAGLISNVCNV